MNSRDKGRREQQHQARDPVQGKDKEQHGQRHQGGEGQLGQVLAEIGIQGLDALDDGVGQLAALLAAGVGWPQGQEVG